LFIAKVDLQFKNSGENGANCVSNAHAYEAICLYEQEANSKADKV